MENIIEVLKTKYRLPVGSVAQTAQEVGAWSLTDQQWADIAKEIHSEAVIVDHRPHHSRYITRYFINNVIKQFNDGAVINVDEAYNKALNEAKAYIANNPWVFAEPETEPKLNADGTAAPKKGDKKVIVKDLYEKHKNDGYTRKQWIDLFVKEANMSPAGASTYLANLKSGKY